MARNLPNVIVYAALAGLLIVGHTTGWKLPKVSELFAAHAAPDQEWCTEHLVPEAICVECNHELLPQSREFGFCRQHGVAECVNCHPELAQVAGEPKLPSYDTVKAVALIARPTNNSRNTLHKRLVQFASAESADKAGIDVDVVGEQPMTDAITANGELTFDPARVAHLSSRVSGTVTHVFKTIGDDVHAGDVLALVDAALVGQAKATFLHAVAQLQLRKANEKRLREAQNAVPGRSLIEAETARAEAEISALSARQALVNFGFEVPDDLEREDPHQIAEELRFLGISEEHRQALPPGTRTANLIPVYTAYDGMVVASDVVAGEVVTVSNILYTVADPQRLLLTLHIRQEDAPYVSAGLHVVFHTDDQSQEAAGQISWISPAVDERTRTLQARVKLENTTGTLRDKTFGTGRIILREEPRAVVVPREAVQSTSDAHFVFVRDKNYLREDAPKVFHVRQVRLGARDEPYVEILAGALPGEVVATKGSAVLLAQLLRSNLGAGCGCHEH